MEEREVLRKLGFTSETEEQARKELNSVEQLKPYKVEYAEEDENYYDLLSNNTEKELDKIIKSFSAHHQLILPIFYYAYGRIIITGWRACLYNELQYVHKGAKRDKSWIKKRYEEKADQKENNHVDWLMSQLLSDKKHGEISKQYHMDVGHVFGRFTDLTPLISDFLDSDQNHDHINIYPEFKSANENDKKDGTDYGQLHFENEAKSNKPCYYEAEAIFRDWNDVVPIGTRIRIIDINNSKELHHVFIPNVVHGKFPKDSILNDDATAADYRKFFEEGDLEALKKKEDKVLDSKSTK